MTQPEKYGVRELSSTATWDERLVGKVRQAAVMVLISGDEADRRILFTQRAQGISQAGHVSFPGGGREGEENPEQTALRETQEEIGLDPDDIRVWGRLPARMASRLHVDPVAVVGQWSGNHRLLQPNTVEVERILDVPVKELANPAARVTWELSHGHSGPGFLVDGVFIWGMTAGIADALLELCGWAQQWDHERRVPVPPEFR